VLADTCTEAGILATLAMLQGTAAEQFLDEQQVKYWIIR
jgi:thiamine biosynthesis lipoprotein